VARVSLPKLGYDWPWRFGVAVSSVFLVVAAILVRFVQLSRWRGTLGAMIPSEAASSLAQANPRARSLAGTIERAAVHLPFATKCLPRAVALQWRLRFSGIPSDLVVAFHLADRASEHGFHAWVEHAGEIVIGDCDRAVYRPVLRLSQGAAPALGPA
jgi:hypothetical protein